MKQNHEILPLIEAIMQYDQRDVVPFDVPGHKHGRGTKELVDFFGEKVMRIDVNSMKCLDNIGNPVGVIKEARVFDSCIVKKSLKPLERLYFFVKFHISILSTFEPCVII